MIDSREIERTIRDGQRILRTAKPNERQRNWRLWSERVNSLLTPLAPEVRPNLRLGFETLSQDLQELETLLRDRNRNALAQTGDVINGRTQDQEAAPTNGAEPDDQEDNLNTPVRVFLSYRSEDEKIAQVIKEELESLHERVEVFAAVDDLRTGAPWRLRLHEEIKKSSWFILLYTDAKKDWQWPIYEATTFEAVHAGRAASDRRLCCLHDTDERPKPLNDFQSRKIDSFIPNPDDDDDVHSLVREKFYQDTPVFRFLKDFISYPEGNPIARNNQRLTRRLVDMAEHICETFKKNRQDTKIREFYYPAWIDVTFDWTKNHGKSGMLEDAVVSLGPIAERIFKIRQIEEMKWPKFRDRFGEQADGDRPMWIRQLEDALLSAARGAEPDAITALMYSTWTRRFYRPLLTRQEHYLSGKRKFYVVLVEQPPSDFGQHEELGTLLAAIIYGSRFRFEFIDRRLKDLYAKDWAEEFVDLCTNIGSQIVAIEAESAQHGLLDQDALIGCFDNADRERVIGWYRQWHDIRKNLFAAIDRAKSEPKAHGDTRNLLIHMLEHDLRTINSQFMRVASSRYERLVHGAFTVNQSGAA